jgi:hypothetical protein
MKFIVSTNKTFINMTYPKIVGGLLDAGVPNNDIIVFEGDNSHYEWVNTKEQIHYYKVPHNSMDFNGLISVIELGFQSDRWFVLHDTCIIGPNFYNYVKNFKHEYPVTPISSFVACMNLGSYSHDWLIQNRQEILTLKNTGDLSEYKKKLVLLEDYFLNPYKEFSHYVNKKPIVIDSYDIYGNGIPRITWHFEDIDLGKSKANWHPKDNYELGL